MVVQHNITAMNANRYFGINNKKLSKSLEKLSSGYAINRAGDNAAGLAVSEKMRSQIAGMTQAVKNAQDGISMVQTYEGALTETDSILQRMKTLATQIANGGYDDPVDRTAAQQEFYQLNDELDQIADTDYNGVVVLNGGKMADGTTASPDGLINYVGGKDTAASPSTNLEGLSDEEFIAAIEGAAKGSEKELGTDLSAEAEIGVVNHNAYDRLASIEDKEAAGFTKVVADDGTVTYEKTVGYVYDADKGEWLCSEDDTGLFRSKDNGGFLGMYGETVTIPGDDTIKDGSYVAVKYTIGKDAVEATAAVMPKAIDAKVEVETEGNIKLNGNEDTFKFEDDLTKTAGGTDLTEEELEDLINAVNGLNNATIKIATNKKYDNAAGIVDFNGSDFTSAGDFTITPTGGTPAIKIINDNRITADEKQIFGIADDSGNITFYYAKSAITGNKTVDDITTGDNKDDVVKVGTLHVGSFSAITKADDAVKGDENGAYTYTLHVAQGTAGSAAADAGDNDIQAVAASQEMLKALKDKLNGVSDEEEDTSDYKVSQSNAFNNSEAKMTYKSHIILQVGARTKDAVDFTFAYDSDAIGDLKADLNCTAAGLGTDKLDIKTQESANYAIDKIDQALNKVSLVRGTFGAIQNRLDHKIDNLNVTVENLTDAESRIRDTNMAEEMMNFTKNQILSQASQSMLAQANQLPQSVLQLLQ